MANVTLVITTFNRAAILQRALNSIAQTPNFSAHAELIIVDNNSTDRTKDVCISFIADHPEINTRYVFEESQGLSFARNRGIKESQDEYIVFMDDDQEIDKNYIPSVKKCFEETGAACIGGKIKYMNSHTIPIWLHPLIETVGQIDLGDSIIYLDGQSQFLKGGNIAFRKSALFALGGFNTTLGRIGNSLGAAEEDEIQNRLVNNEQKIAYTPDLIQYNWLLPEKFSKSYWRRQAYWSGKTQYELSFEHWKNAKIIFGIPGSIVVNVMKAAIKYLASIFSLRTSNFFNKERDFLEAVGVLVAAYQKARALSRTASSF